MRTTKTVLLGTIFSAGILCVATSPAIAQFRGAIEGTVMDASGAIIPGAKVNLTNNETRRSQQVLTSGEGFYHFAGLAPGSTPSKPPPRGCALVP